MARAKHQEILRQREFVSFVKKNERAEKHEELLKAHSERKRSNRKSKALEPVTA